MTVLNNLAEVNKIYDEVMFGVVKYAGDLLKRYDAIEVEGAVKPLTPNGDFSILGGFVQVTYKKGIDSPSIKSVYEFEIYEDDGHPLPRTVGGGRKLFKKLAHKASKELKKQINEVYNDV